MLMLASCSNDEVMDVRQDAISFSVNTGAISRAENIFCNNAMPSQFKVYATYRGKTYIDGDNIEKDGSSWKNTSGVRYWPDTETNGVDFYAAENATVAWSSGVPAVTTFTVADDVASQKDFIYAVKKGAKRVDNSGQVDLNFRHALSQIVFQAKNTNPNLHVEIDGVTVCNVSNSASFAFPTSSTDTKYGVHNSNGTTINYDESWGTWSNLSGTQSYSVTFNKVDVSDNNTVVDLTSGMTDGDPATTATGNVMLLLPQTKDAWNGTGAITSATGTYFKVKCKIRNVAGETVADDDIVLWGNNGATKDAAVPFAANWEQGKRYVYTFVFGDGNGGIDPENPDNPVLLPITFDVTVDDFVPVDASDVEMKKPETPAE